MRSKFRAVGLGAALFGVAVAMAALVASIVAGAWSDQAGRAVQVARIDAWSFGLNTAAFGIVKLAIAIVLPHPETAQEDPRLPDGRLMRHHRPPSFAGRRVRARRSRGALGSAGGPTGYTGAIHRRLLEAPRPQPAERATAVSETKS